MKRKIENWTVNEIYKKREDISFPDFQREPYLWNKEMKALLIDSIINDYDIPKLYFYYKDSDASYDVIDGQQRLWAIWQFIDNEYEIVLRGKKALFNDLPKKTQNTILAYTLQISVISGDYDEFMDRYLRDMFLRLQLGLLLVAGEKLNASKGSMRNFVFKEMKQHSFIEELGIPSRRFAKETLCAQICANSYYRATEDTFVRTRYDDLRLFFEEFSKPSGQDKVNYDLMRKRVDKTLNKLYREFSGRLDIIRNRSLALSIYLIFEEYIENKQEKKLFKFADFTEELTRRLKEESAKGFDRTNEILYKFSSYLNNAPGERYQIANRHREINELYNFFLKNRKIKGD